jgi:hypothetical protein
VGKFVLVYIAGRFEDGLATDDEQMTEWVRWLGSLGSSVLDAGASFDATATVSRDRVDEPASLRLSGYTIIECDTLDRAVHMARKCPVIDGGGVVHVLGALDD